MNVISLKKKMASLLLKNLVKKFLTNAFLCDIIVLFLVIDLFMFGVFKWDYLLNY